MSRPTHLGLRHLALTARALEAMKRFYVEMLGFTVEWEPDPDNVYLTSGGDNLALHRSTALAAGRAAGGHAGGPLRADDAGGHTGPLLRPDDASGHTGPPAQPGALDHLGLLVGRAGDVDAWAAFLEAGGVTLDTRPRTHRDGSRSIYFRDPDGNRIQIIWIPNIADR